MQVASGRVSSASLPGSRHTCTSARVYVVSLKIYKRKFRDRASSKKELFLFQQNFQKTLTMRIILDIILNGNENHYHL